MTVSYTHLDVYKRQDPARRAKYHGAVEKDPYGRELPKQAHGSINLDGHTSSTRKIDVYKRQPSTHAASS